MCQQQQQQQQQEEEQTEEVVVMIATAGRGGKPYFRQLVHLPWLCRWQSAATAAAD
jgi:hypothetical protein